ncbi:Lipoprotein [Comamonas aquatilis]|uniref:hypothetical protein n=1 Tax=Comamonas aquatilis TaxID=1778406 RepID=UPI0039EF06BF
MPWTVFKAACALSAAVLLAACDKPASKAPANAPAASAVDSVQPAPAEKPQADPAKPGAQEVLIPYKGPDTEPGLASMAMQVGKYHSEGLDYLKEGVLAKRLKALLGEQYATLLENLGTSGPLEQHGQLLSLTGNRPHQGGDESAAIVIDPARNGLRVWLQHQGQQTVFTDVEGDAIAWPEPVQVFMDNAMGK